MRRHRLFAFGLCALGALLFLPSLGFEFVTDDDRLHLKGALGTWPQYWFRPLQGLFIPVAYSVWGLLARLSLALTGAVQPVFFHGANLALHGLNGWLLYRWLMALGAPALGALAGTALFVLHPVQVEPVVWVSGLRDLGATTGLLLFLHGLWAQRPVLATVAWVAGLLCKPVGVVALPALVWLNLTVRERRPAKVHARWWALWVSLALGVGWVAQNAQPTPVVDLSVRVRTAADSVVFYLSKLALPFGLTLDYGRELAAAPWAVVVLAALLALGVFYFGLRRPSGLWTGVGWYLLFLAPVSGLWTFHFQRLSTVADRYQYPALVGWALAVALMPFRRRVYWGLMTLWVVVTAFQVPHWSNELTLYRRMVEVHGSTDNWYRYGMALVGVGRKWEAVGPLRAAALGYPPHGNGANNLALLHAEFGDWEGAERELRRAFSLSPDAPGVRANLETVVRRRLALGKEDER